MLRAGDRVGNRYELIEPIGGGGMGTLWRAHHLELDVDVALKVLLVDRATPDLLKRFKREAQASARLRSPNIVHVHDYGVHDDQPYLAMELLRGEDLAARLASQKRLSLEHAVGIMQAVARAMQLAHEAEIVHRDLKPANIFLEKIGDQEVVKVLDFGVAKDLRSQGDTSGVTTGAGMVGSPAYMSPEQVWGESVDSRADVWAMGVVMFEMLTGKCPFEDDTLAKIFERIIRGPIPKIRDFNPALPPSLDAFFDKALARAPTDRIASAKEFGEALRRALETDALPVVAAFSNATLAAPEPKQLAMIQDTLPGHEAAPFVKMGRPLGPPPIEPPPGVSRHRAPWLGVLALAVLGVGLSLRLATRSDPAPPRETPAIRNVATPPHAESSARQLAPTPPVIDAGPEPSARETPTAAPPRTSPPAAHGRPSASIDGAPPPVDPTFGIPRFP